MLSWRGPGHPQAGGAEVYTAEVLQELARRGHEVVWLCEGGRELPGVTLWAVGSPPYARARAVLRASAARFEVVVDQINGRGFLTPLYSPLPVLTFIHQVARELWAEFPRWWGRRLGPALERLGLQPYRRLPFVTVSRTTLQDMRALGWVGPGFLAFNGVRLGPVPRKEAQPTLVFLGRLSAPGKRLDHALAAHRLLRRQQSQARLWLIGRGAPPTPLPEGVVLFPDVDDALRDELLGRAWAVIATSVREGWGRMVLEAAAVGTAAVVYDSPGLAEAASAVHGILTRPEPAALAASLAEACQDPAALFRRGLAARQAAAAFTWSAAAEVWEQALYTAIAHGAPRRLP